MEDPVKDLVICIRENIVSNIAMLLTLGVTKKQIESGFLGLIEKGVSKIESRS